MSTTVNPGFYSYPPTVSTTVSQPAQQMTSTGWWPPSLAQATQQAAPPPPWVVTDMALNESGIVLDAGFQKILVSKGHLKRLLTLIHMAELCELVGVDDDVSQ